MHDARLVWVTPDAEKVIAYCARVSNPANQENYETAPKLLRYCIDHKHWSIFEMASMCLEVNTTRAISAQLIRHRSLSIQEFSTRYSPVLERPAVPELRLQDPRNRQNSLPMEDQALEEVLGDRIAGHLAQTVELYGELLKAGVAREVARDILPLSTPTRLYVSGTIRSWIHYTQLRCGNGTQKEHRLIAESARRILFEQLPTIKEALRL